ncbi:MAG: ABC transporter permease [Acidobacteriota bacterium]
MMLRGLWKLTWVELKVFLREPLGFFATVALPLIVFLLLGRSLGDDMHRATELESFVRVTLPVLASLLMTLTAATSLIAIIAIYREAGILKRLRATPLRPQTILAAHVALKLGLTALTLGLMLLAGKRFYPVDLAADLLSFTVALLLSTLSVLSLGFVIASLVPTARFARPAGSAVLYPLLAISGLFAPIEALPGIWQKITLFSPVTHAVTLLQGIWNGESWSAHGLAVVALLANLAICTALSAKIFKWE